MSQKDDHPLDIVSFLGRDWEFWQRKPHMEGLSQYSRLLCVEPPFTIATLFRSPMVFWKGVRGEKGLRRVSDTLWLFKPVAVFPYSVSMRVPWLGVVNRIVVGVRLKSVVAKLEMREPIVVIEHPAQNYVIGMLGEKLLCYEVHDAYAEVVTMSSGMKRTAVLREEETLKRADIVLTTARNLAQTKRKLNPMTHFIPNAADADFFAKSMDPGTVVPADLEEIPKPRIGLIGHISESHTDVDLLRYLAEEHPDWSVVVIGRLDAGPGFKKSAGFTGWLARPNAHYLGFRAYETLPAYLKGFDVCLLPYVINDYTANVFPNKLFQYLAGGKPVVSADIPEMRPYKGIIAIANDHAEFGRLVEAALAGSSPKQVAQRIEVARENSVVKRAELEVSLLKRCLGAGIRAGADQ